VLFTGLCREPILASTPEIHLLTYRCALVCVCVCVCVQILFLVQDGNLRALVTGHSLFWLPLSGTTFLLTSHIAVRSHSSKRLLEHFSLLLPALNYSNPLLSPFLTRRMFVRPNILRTLRRTMIRFLIELLLRRICFGQSKLYFILNWLVMRCKLRPELAADAQQTA